MTKEEIYRIEAAVHALVNNQVIFEALNAVAIDEVLSAEQNTVLAVRSSDIAAAQLFVGQTDGIRNLLASLKRLAREYTKRTTSET